MSEDGLSTGDSRNGAHEQPQKASREGWAEAKPYDYKSFEMLNGLGQSGIESSVHWDGLTKRFEWSDEFGDVVPRIPELEESLFGKENVPRAGLDFAKVLNVQVSVVSEEKIGAFWDFKDMGLHPVIEENITLCRYDRPTPIQAYVIPAIVSSKDVIATAQTGSGKTCAYLVPILSKLMGKAKKLQKRAPLVEHGVEQRDRYRAQPLVLVVVPTRELAIQVFRDTARLCYRSMLRPCVAYGGMFTRENIDDITQGCDILIGTPGRLMDLLGRQHILDLNRCRFTVIDEADELMQGDWEEQISKLMANRDDDHLFAMFSATFPRELQEVALRYMASDHVELQVGRAGSSNACITQRVQLVDRNQKLQALEDLLSSVPGARTIIFANSAKTCENVDDHLYHLGFPVTSIHAGRNQREREDAIRSIRSGQCPILVATGVLSRGVDIPNVMHVINFDLPSSAYGGIGEYVHRIGRTARIGHKGLATSFYNDGDEGLAEDLVKVLLESENEIPDFLEIYRPVDGVLRFEEESADRNVDQAELQEEASVQAAPAEDW